MTNDNQQNQGSFTVTDFLRSKFAKYATLGWFVAASLHLVVFSTAELSNGKAAILFSTTTRYLLTNTLQFGLIYGSWLPLAVLACVIAAKFDLYRGVSSRKIVIHGIAALSLPLCHILLTTFINNWLRTQEFGTVSFDNQFMTVLFGLLHLEMAIYPSLLVLFYRYEYAQVRQSKLMEYEKIVLNEQNYIAYFSLREGDKTIRLPIEQVVWIEAADNYAKIHTESENYLYRATISALERKLNPNSFRRIHRGRIVNTNKVQEIERRKNGDIALRVCDKTVLDVSRRRRAQVSHLLRSH